MPGLVSDATRVWEANVYWPMNAQCAVWDVKGKGVDVWECIRPREHAFFSRLVHEAEPCTLVQISLMLKIKYVRHFIFSCLVRFAVTRPMLTHFIFFQPPNNQYWRYVTRR